MKEANPFCLFFVYLDTEQTSNRIKGEGTKREEGEGRQCRLDHSTRPLFFLRKISGDDKGDAARVLAVYSTARARGSKNR